MTGLAFFYVTNGGSNPGITCAPACVLTIGSRSVPSTACPSNQDIGLCGMIAATNIHSISGYSQWSCTTGGYTSTSPCTSPMWPGVSCVGSNVVSMNIGSLGVTGSI